MRFAVLELWLTSCTWRRKFRHRNLLKLRESLIHEIAFALMNELYFLELSPDGFSVWLTTAPSYVSNKALWNSISSSSLGLSSFVTSMTQYISSWIPRIETCWLGNGKNFGFGWYLSKDEWEGWKLIRLYLYQLSSSFFSCALQISIMDGPKYDASAADKGIS